MKKIYMLLFASAFPCNILSAAAINYRSLDGAVERNEIQSVRNFLKENRDIDINHKNVLGATPLYIASWYGHIELASLFLDNGADPDVSSSGATPLECALDNGHIALAKLLLNRGADVNVGIDPNVSFHTPLHMAVRTGDEELVRMLLEHGIIIDIDDEFDQTAAYLARDLGFYDIEQLITSWNPNDGTEIKEPEGQ